MNASELNALLAERRELRNLASGLSAIRGDWSKTEDLHAELAGIALAPLGLSKAETPNGVGSVVAHGVNILSAAAMGASHADAQDRDVLWHRCGNGLDLSDWPIAIKARILALCLPLDLVLLDGVQ